MSTVLRSLKKPVSLPVSPGGQNGRKYSMNKSATGTEYVNAQMKELKLLIDKLASEIHAPSTGLVFTKLFTGRYAFIQANLITDEYNGGVRCRLQVRGGEWNGYRSYGDTTVDYHGSMSISENVVPEGLRPSENMSISGDTYWRTGTTGGGTVNMSLSTGGNLSVTVTGSGPFNRTFEWML